MSHDIVQQVPFYCHKCFPKKPIMFKKIIIQDLHLRRSDLPRAVLPAQVLRGAHGGGGEGHKVHAQLHTNEATTTVSRVSKACWICMYMGRGRESGVNLIVKGRGRGSRVPLCASSSKERVVTAFTSLLIYRVTKERNILLVFAGSVLVPSQSVLSSTSSGGSIFTKSDWECLENIFSEKCCGNYRYFSAVKYKKEGDRAGVQSAIISSPSPSYLYRVQEKVLPERSVKERNQNFWSKRKRLLD